MIHAGNHGMISSLYQKVTSRRRFRTCFRKELAAARAVQVYLHANAVAIELAGDGGSVAAIRAVTRELAIARVRRLGLAHALAGPSARASAAPLAASDR